MEEETLPETGEAKEARQAQGDHQAQEDHQAMEAHQVEEDRFPPDLTYPPISDPFPALRTRGQWETSPTSLTGTEPKLKPSSTS